MLKAFANQVFFRESKTKLPPRHYDISLLPGKPTQFFGLERNFNLRDLKRSYGQAIRQYRPESSAHEFQLIRAAYEQLERSLSYNSENSSSTFVPHVLPQTQEDSEASGPTVSPAISEIVDPLQIAIEDPFKAIQQLRSKRNWSPDDYIEFALLTDLKGGSDQFEFLTSLLDGLSKHPNHPALYGLVADYLNNDVTDDQIREALLLVAKKLRSSSFYDLTLNLWKRYFRPQLAMQATVDLSECEALIPLCAPSIGIQFNLEILPIAAWTADFAWVESRLSQMDADTFDFPDYLLEYHQNVVNYIQYVRNQRYGDNSGNDNPYRKAAHECLRSWGASNDPHRDEKCIDFFEMLSERQKELSNLSMATALIRNEKKYFTSFQLIEATKFVGDKLAAEYVPTAYLFNMECSDESLKNLFNDLHWDVSKINLFRRLPRILLNATLILSVVVFILVIVVSVRELKFEEKTAGNIFGGALALVFGLYFILVGPWLQRRIQLIEENKLLQLYKHYWRSSLFSFFRHNPMDVTHFLGRLQNRIHEAQDLEIVKLLNQTLVFDDSLHLYACAQRFRV